MTIFWILVVAIAAAGLLCKTIDRAACWRHWRVGRWGRILCVWQRVGEECVACRTDYRYVFGHPIRYAGTTRETARAILPLCQRCWLETDEAGRLEAAAQILNAWRDAGVYGDGFDQEQWDTDRFEIYTAIKANL